MEKATKETAEKIIELLRHGLPSGMGRADSTGRGIPGQMCVEAAVCYAMGLPHGDEPVCVSGAIRAFKIRLNDRNWSSNTVRAEGMKRLAIAQLNSAGAVDDKEFVKRLIDLVIRKMVPFALREAARVHPDQNHKDSLEAAAKQCEAKGTREAALKAKAAAYAADAAASSAYAFGAAANAAAYAAANAAAYAAANAANAADAAANAANAADAACAAVSAACAARDKFLAFIAEEVVQILIDMKAPGTEWLDLAPIKEAA